MAQASSSDGNVGGRASHRLGEGLLVFQALAELLTVDIDADTPDREELGELIA
jgi:hypothetical protein